MPIYVVSRLTQCLGGVERCFVSCALMVMIALGVACRGGNVMCLTSVIITAIRCMGVS